MTQTLTPKGQSAFIDEGLIGFFTSYRGVPWDNLLSHAQESLDIVVYYWDKWINRHQQELKRFLENPKAKLRIFLSDERKPDILVDILRFFPNQTAGELKEKIKNTYLPLNTYNNVEVYRYPHLLNYSMQCIDDKVLILSFFEISRQEAVDSPSIVIDLTKSPKMKQFYQKEIQILQKGSASTTY
jgi:hypothetical protein